MPDPAEIRERFEELRAELRAERMSYGELAELQDLAEYIEPGDVELLEAAGVPEHDEHDATTLPRIYYTPDVFLYHERVACPALVSTPAFPVRVATGAKAIRVMGESRPCVHCAS